MSGLEAFILGLVQGLTEFLPVSSSGHLAIISNLFGVNPEENLTFAIVVHAATVLSTIFVLWSDISRMVTGFFRFQWNEETQMVCKILVSMIPVGIVGVFFKDTVEELFGSGLLVVGCMLLVTALLLSFAYFAHPRVKGKITFRDAFIIGIAQAVAVMPGLSRSGSTISTGLLLGIQKEKVARFSFLMVLIPIIGEALLDLMKGHFAASSIPASSLCLGFIAAFVSGAFACRWMINIVNKGKLIWFAVYCVAAGLFSIIYSLV